MNKSQTKARDYMVEKIKEKSEEERDFQEEECRTCGECTGCYNGDQHHVWSIEDMGKYQYGVTCFKYILKNGERMEFEKMSIFELQEEINEFKKYFESYKKPELKI